MLDGRDDIGQAGQVEHPVHALEVRPQALEMGHVDPLHLEGGVVPEARQVLLPAGAKVVQDPHPVAVAEQALHQMAADEACSASDEGLSGHGQPFQIAYRGGKPKPLA